MKEFILIIGWIIMIVGSFLSLASNANVMLLICLFAGAVLFGIYKIIALLEQMNVKQVPIPLSDHHIAEVISNSRVYEVLSTQINLFPMDRYPYPVIVLEGNYYMPVEFLTNHYTEDGTEYVFMMPSRDPLRLRVTPTYNRKVALFEFEGEVYVCLQKVGLSILLSEGKAIISTDYAS